MLFCFVFQSVRHRIHWALHIANGSQNEQVAFNLQVSHPPVGFFFSSSLAICQINQFPAYCPALSHNLHFVDYILAASFTCSCVLSTSCKLAAGSRSLGRAGVTWLQMEDHNTPNRDTVMSLVPKNHTRATDLNKSPALVDNFLLKGNRRHQHSKKEKSI